MDYLLLAGLILLCALFIYEMVHSFRRSNITNRLINTYSEDTKNPALIGEIYSYISKDMKLRRIVKKYGAEKSDIEKLYHKLLLWGNFKKGRRFVPISSFFYAYSLEYLLKNKDEDAKKLTMKMMNFFHF